MVRRREREGPDSTAVFAGCLGTGGRKKKILDWMPNWEQGEGGPEVGGMEGSGDGRPSPYSSMQGLYVK